jgi:hypothetical protein
VSLPSAPHPARRRGGQPILRVRVCLAVVYGILFLDNKLVGSFVCLSRLMFRYVGHESDNCVVDFRLSPPTPLVAELRDKRFTASARATTNLRKPNSAKTLSFQPETGG